MEYHCYATRGDAAAGEPCETGEDCRAGRCYEERCTTLCSEEMPCPEGLVCQELLVAAFDPEDEEDDLYFELCVPPEG